MIPVKSEPGAPVSPQGDPVEDFEPSLDRLEPSMDSLEPDTNSLEPSLESPEPSLESLLLGGSTEMRQVGEQIDRIAPTHASVLISGESGTGKEKAAEAIYRLSLRKEAPFIAVNCGAMSPQLIESELFGHERGSFTGAVRDHSGHFERANGGTLFLDEITEMSAELQVKLLRVLETGHFLRVGGTREIKVDVRIIAATNRDPHQAVEEGMLRRDLLYRIQVFHIHLPPLRERIDDIEMISRFFLERYNNEEKAHKRFSPAALTMMQSYSWPGNLRELRNVVYRAFVMADELIETTHLPADVTVPRPSLAGPSVCIQVGSSLADAERRIIMATLESCKGRRDRAAQVLGVSVKTLYNRLREYRNRPVDETDTLG